MKGSYTLALLLFLNTAIAQIYSCKNGTLSFVSEAPLELIKAESKKLTGGLDLTAKNFAFSVDIDSFDGFNSSLQKEHFRENYMETDKYSRATFKGKIIEDVDLSKDGSVTVRAKGNFSIHGAEKEQILKVKITRHDNSLFVQTNFDVLLEDHNIKVPKIVNQKIASVIAVQVYGILKPKS